MNRPARRTALVGSIACCLLALAIVSTPQALQAASGGSSSTAGLVDLAPGSFLLSRQIPIHPYPRALAAGDFDRDGRKDVAVVNSSPASVSILFGMGNGNLGSPHAVGVPKNADSIAVADLNHDGKQDLVVGVGATAGSISVLLGRGDGTFRVRHTYALGYRPGTRNSGTLSIADLNGDHRPDIVAARGNKVMVLLGRGDGTCKAARAYLADAAGSIASFALGKLDGDETRDLVAGSQEGVNTPVGALSVLLGSGSGGFRAATTRRTGLLIPDRLAVRDVNHDGELDLLVANWADVGDYQPDGQDYAAIVVSLGLGDGRFSPLAEYDVGSQGPSAFEVADFDGDRDLDLLMASTAGLTLLLGNGDGSFQAPDQFDATVRQGGALVAVADFNGDGRRDIAAAAGGGDELSVFLNRSGAGTAGVR